MEKFEHIESKSPQGIRKWFTFLLTLPAMLWIGGVLWIFDREDYHRMQRWCFEKRDKPTGDGS